MNNTLLVRQLHKTLVLIVLLSGVNCIYYRGSIVYNGQKTPTYSFLEYKIDNTRIKKGYGSVDFMVQGERVRGEFDLVSYERSDSCIITFYSLFGSRIGKIVYRTDSTIIQLPEKVFYLSSHATIDTLKHLLDIDISIQGLIELIRGELPTEIPPQSMVLLKKMVNGKVSEFTYSDTTQKNIILFLLRSGRLKRIVLDYSSQRKSFLVTLSHFNGTIPMVIHVGADKKNYLKLNYKKIYNE